MSLPSRRVFLQTMAAGAVTLPFLSRTAGAEPPHKFPGVLGLEMYTLRHLFDKDLPGTLQMGLGGPGRVRYRPLPDSIGVIEALGTGRRPATRLS